MGEREQSIARQIAQRVKAGEVTHNIKRDDGFDVKEVANLLHQEGIHVDSLESGKIDETQVLRFQTSKYEGGTGVRDLGRDHLKEARRNIEEANKILEELKRRNREKDPSQES